MASGAKLIGVDAFRAKLAKVVERYPTIVADGLFKETEIERAECQKRAPVYSGPTGPGFPVPHALQQSIHTEGPFRDGQKVWCKILAGGPGVVYATRQHEEIEWFHKIGQAKYVESVILESRPFMATRVAARIGLDLVG